MAAYNAPLPEVESDDGETGLYLPDRSPKKDMRSKLIRSKERAAGLVVNACPFGCTEQQLDAETYCRHVVGFTDPEDEAQFFPLKTRKDPRPNVKGHKFRFVDGDDPQLVEPGDRLVKITTASRVYRPNPGPVPVHEEKAAASA